VHSTQAFPKHSALDFSVSAWDVHKNEAVSECHFGDIRVSITTECRVKNKNAALRWPCNSGERLGWSQPKRTS